MVSPQALWEIEGCIVGYQPCDGEQYGAQEGRNMTAMLWEKFKEVARQ